MKNVKINIEETMKRKETLFAVLWMELIQTLLNSL